MKAKGDLTPSEICNTTISLDVSVILQHPPPPQDVEHAAFNISEIVFLDMEPPMIDRCRSPPPFHTTEKQLVVVWEVPQFSDNSGSRGRSFQDLYEEPQRAVLPRRTIRSLSCWSSPSNVFYLYFSQLTTY